MILSRGQVEYIVGLAITAPSVLNTQPWRFFAHADAIDVLAVPARGLPIVDPAARETYISCGAAVFNLRLGIGELRRTPVGPAVAGSREPGACRQRAHRRTDDAAGRRASSVRRDPRRRTSREPFSAESVPDRSATP